MKVGAGGTAILPSTIKVSESLGIPDAAMQASPMVLIFSTPHSSQMSSKAANTSSSSAIMRSAGMLEAVWVKPQKSVNKTLTES